MSRARRGALTVLAVVALLAGPTGCARKTIYGEGTPRIETSAGRDVVIEVPSDPTTGQQWRIGALPDARVLALLTTDYEAGAASAAGQQRFVFRAVAAGTTTIRLDYGRPWAAPVKSTTFTVLVR